MQRALSIGIEGILDLKVFTVELQGHGPSIFFSFWSVTLFSIVEEGVSAREIPSNYLT